MLNQVVGIQPSMEHPGLSGDPSFGRSSSNKDLKNAKQNPPLYSLPPQTPPNPTAQSFKMRQVSLLKETMNNFRQDFKMDSSNVKYFDLDNLRCDSNDSFTCFEEKHIPLKIKDDPVFKKYIDLIEIHKMPKETVRRKMKNDGYDPNLIDHPNHISPHDVYCLDSSTPLHAYLSGMDDNQQEENIIPKIIPLVDSTCQDAAINTTKNNKHSSTKDRYCKKIQNKSMKYGVEMKDKRLFWECAQCKIPFTHLLFLTKIQKHNCRSCGKVICSKCSRKKILSTGTVEKERRVCMACHTL